MSNGQGPTSLSQWYQGFSRFHFVSLLVSKLCHRLEKALDKLITDKDNRSHAFAGSFLIVKKECDPMNE
ncbi:hypothetical protein DIX90_09885 [Streptococcus iniae]|nr:hypothetical protein DIY04_10860 [Streptococcus iniae]RLU59991.1 hypothetical protein DIY01_09920 [Streptococcus iniae]RLU62802.1 hypothetical protein DIY02_01545 [Streptococcus iniae]RLU72528.1 hypothetical protein DIX97_01550 [Streptococcus iniae]RLU82207.1 hypothetical protein DIX91_09895 [Streptococcus iniae]